jgi:hypothetical protein
MNKWENEFRNSIIVIGPSISFHMLFYPLMPRTRLSSQSGPLFGFALSAATLPACAHGIKTGEEVIRDTVAKARTFFFVEGDNRVPVLGTNGVLGVCTCFITVRTCAARRMTTETQGWKFFLLCLFGILHVSWLRLQLVEVCLFGPDLRLQCQDCIEFSKLSSQVVDVLLVIPESFNDLRASVRHG